MTLRASARPSPPFALGQDVNASVLAATNSIENNFSFMSFLHALSLYQDQIESMDEGLQKAKDIAETGIDFLANLKGITKRQSLALLGEVNQELQRTDLSTIERQSLLRERANILQMMGHAHTLPTTPLDVGLEGVGVVGVLGAAPKYANQVRKISKLERALAKPLVKIGQGSESGFYNSHRIRELLEARYPDRVVSSTVPSSTAKNVKLAGQRHPVSGIVFDQKGLPIFDDVALFDTKIGREFFTLQDPRTHMREATKSLRKEIIKGKINKDSFTQIQLEDIMARKERITEFTWHHHQDIGRMQLIPREIHKKTGHVGGMDMWFQ